LRPVLQRRPLPSCAFGRFSSWLPRFWRVPSRRAFSRGLHFSSFLGSDWEGGSLPRSHS
jgi:hypothetical protein